MPPALPFRDRLVLGHIVEQHAEEAAFLWTLRDAAADAPHYKRHHLARLDERVEAHVDGLRVAGEAGWRIALEQLDRRCEKGELFAAGVLALESGDMRRIEPLVALAEAEPEARRGFVGAVAQCRPAALAPTVRRWAGSTEAFGRYLALCACSVHRAGGRSEVAGRVGDADARVRARALRLAGELGRIELRETCLDRLGDEEEGAGFWAAWSAVLLGDRGAALQALADAVVSAQATPRRQAALEAAVRAMGVERGARFIRALNGDARLRSAATAALGHLGDPAAAPWLIERMSAPELARLAGESFAMISGAQIEEDGLERQSVPGNDAADPAEAGGGDEFLPWPDQGAVAAWWRRQRERFASGTRYLLGSPLDDASASERAWGAGSQRQRRAAAYESASRRPGSALPNWRAGVAGAFKVDRA